MSNNITLHKKPLFDRDYVICKEVFSCDCGASVNKKTNVVPSNWKKIKHF